MHKANRAFWEYCEGKYGLSRGGMTVLEVGSYNINGSLRENVKHPAEYVGIDWRPGPGVDFVCFAHDMNFHKKFDAVISASMLEHDRHWEKSIPKMVEHMKDTGVLVLSWGAALNPPHRHETADDGKFHPLPAYKVFKLLGELGMHIHEFRYEGLQFPEVVARQAWDGEGEVGLVAFKDKAYAVGESHLDELAPADSEPAQVKT